VKRGDAWQALDNVPLRGGDIDHVLVAPGGVLAIETKFFSKESRAKYLDEQVRDAERCVTRVRGIMTTLRAHRHPVQGVLVVWGPGGKALRD
jgi:hypothetical protein